MDGDAHLVLESGAYVGVVDKYVYMYIGFTCKCIYMYVTPQMGLERGTLVHRPHTHIRVHACVCTHRRCARGARERQSLVRARACVCPHARATFPSVHLVMCVVAVSGRGEQACAADVRGGVGRVRSRGLAPRVAAQRRQRALVPGVCVLVHTCACVAWRARARACRVMDERHKAASVDQEIAAVRIFTLHHGTQAAAFETVKGQRPRAVETANRPWACGMT